MAHTPGPWRVEKIGYATLYEATLLVEATDGESGGVAALWRGDENAALIAAAPDLLAAGKKILADIDEAMAIERLQFSSTPKGHYTEGINLMLLAVRKADGLDPERRS